MQKQFNRNLRLGYGVSLLVLIVVGVFCYRTMGALLTSDREVNESYVLIEKLEKALSLMKDAETGQRGYLLTGKQRFLEPYHGAAQRALQLVDQAAPMTTQATGRRQLADIRQIIVQRMTILSALIEKKNAGRQITEDDLDTGKSAMDALRQAVNAAESNQQQLMLLRAGRLAHYRAQMPVLILGALAVAVLVAFFSYFKVTGDMRERDRLYLELDTKEQETAAFNEELTAANEELTATNEELLQAREALAGAKESLEQRVAERTEELAASEEETQALNEELTAMNEELAATNEELLVANHELSQADQFPARLRQCCWLQLEQLREARSGVIT